MRRWPVSVDEWLWVLGAAVFVAAFMFCIIGWDEWRERVFWRDVWKK